MSETVRVISHYLDSLLEPNESVRQLSRGDIAYNGLQVWNDLNSTVRKILFSVDFSQKAITYALDKECQMIVTHHGAFWKTASPINEFHNDRMRRMYLGKLNLYSSHLPLDVNPDFGNNAEIAKEFGAKLLSPFNGVGYIAEMREALNHGAFFQLLRTTFGESVEVIGVGRQYIKRVAICSGAGGYPSFYEFLNSGADILITGDSFEIYSTAADAGVNVAFCGHHQTETFGIKALSNKILLSNLNVGVEYMRDTRND